MPGWLDRPMRGLDLAPMQWYEAWFDSGLSLVGWDGLIYDTYLPSIPSPQPPVVLLPPREKEKDRQLARTAFGIWRSMVYLYAIHVYD